MGSYNSAGEMAIAPPCENNCRFKLKSLISEDNGRVLINTRCDHYFTLFSLKK